ncbi:hypothetical protein [Maritimibacter alexandrii]|uniref:hypothetical protein n=1 Tax=Maritimibacter alexandrii TaxID=2570355 RepID=UPI001107F769|nr:hypothetical protein [Maritimibacter alexandrii]
MPEKQKFAFLVDGVVEAVRNYVPGREPEGLIAVTEATGPAGPGFSWDGATFAPPPPEDIPAEDLPGLVRQEGRRRLAALVAEYSDLERETWKGQLAEARIVVVDGGTSSLVEALASPRGLSATEMAQTIIAKDAALKAAIGPILAAQEALLNADPIPQDYRDASHWPS